MIWKSVWGEIMVSEERSAIKYTTISIEKGGEAEQLLLNLVASLHKEKKDIVLMALQNLTQAGPNAEVRILEIVKQLKLQSEKQEGILFAKDIDIYLSLENIKTPLSENMQAIVRKILQREMAVDGIMVDDRKCIFYSSIVDKVVGRKTAEKLFKKQ